MFFSSFFLLSSFLTVPLLDEPVKRAEAYQALRRFFSTSEPADFRLSRLGKVAILSFITFVSRLRLWAWNGENDMDELADSIVDAWTGDADET